MGYLVQVKEKAYVFEYSKHFNSG